MVEVQNRDDFVKTVKLLRSMDFDSVERGCKGPYKSSDFKLALCNLVINGKIKGPIGDYIEDLEDQIGKEEKENEKRNEEENEEGDNDS